MRSEAFRSEKLGTLTDEYEQADVDLRETRERPQDEWEDRRSCHRRADSLEVRQEERRVERARLQTSNADFEQRCVWLHVETRELREELAQRARGAAQRGSVVHRARQGACGDEFAVWRTADPLR